MPVRSSYNSKFQGQQPSFRNCYQPAPVKIPRLSWKSNFHYSTHKSTNGPHTESHYSNPHTHTPFFGKHLNIIFAFISSYHSGLLRSGFSMISSSSMYATCLAHPALLDLLTQYYMIYNRPCFTFSTLFLSHFQVQMFYFVPIFWNRLREKLIQNFSYKNWLRDHSAQMRRRYRWQNNIKKEIKSRYRLCLWRTNKAVFIFIFIFHTRQIATVSVSRKILLLPVS